MPFTVSHVAAVLPGYRWLSRAHVFTAAVIGSMVPDFGLLVPGPLMRWQTHSMAALISFCLPMGLMAYWVTLLLIRPAALEVVPDRVYVRLRAGQVPSVLQLRAWLYAAAAILLGAMTHLVWDGFTHEDARGVRMFPMLSDYEPEMDGHPVQLYRLLQYGSSVAGLTVLVGALLLWLHHAPAPVPAPLRRIGCWQRRTWLAAYVVPTLLVMAWEFLRYQLASGAPFSIGAVLHRVLIHGMQCSAASLLLVSAAIRARLAVRC